MAGPTALGIVIDLSTRGAEKALGAFARRVTTTKTEANLLKHDLMGVSRAIGRGLGSRISKARKSMDGLSKSFKSLLSSGSEFQQRIANITNSLDDLSGGFSKVSQASAGLIKDTTGAFSDVEDGFAKVDIALGFLGDQTNDVSRQLERAAIQDKIKQIGLATEFTQAEAADAFATLKQAGLSANEAMALIDQTMAFSSASGGTVGLADSASLAFASFNKLKQAGETTEQALARTNKAFDIFTKTATETNLQFNEFQQVFDSTNAGLLKFKDTSVSTFAAVSSALKDMGKSPASAGVAIDSLSRSAQNMLTEFQRMEKGIGRRTAKRLGLQDLNITKEDLKAADGNLKDLNGMVDLFITKRNEALAKGIDPAEVDAMIKGILGSTEAVDVIIATSDAIARREKDGVKSLTDLSNMLADSSGFAALAQQRNLETVTGQMALFGSAVDALKVNIGAAAAEIGKDFVNQLRQLVTQINDFSEANPALVKSFVKVVVGITAISGGLAVLFGAAAVVMKVFTVFSPIIGTLISAMAKFGGVIPLIKAALASLAPMFIPVILFMAKAALAAAIMREIWTQDLGGIRTFVMGWAADLKDLFKVVGPLLSGQGVDSRVWDSLSKRTQRLAIIVVLLRNRLRDFVAGVKSGFIPTFKLAVSVVTFVAGKFVKLVNLLADAGILTTKLTLSTKQSKQTFKFLGQVVGVLIGVFAIWKATMVAGKLAMVAFKIITLGFKAVLLALKAALFVARAAMFAFNLVVSANPVVLLVLGILALIAAIILLIYHWDEVTAFLLNATKPLGKALFKFAQKVKGFFVGIFTAIRDFFVSIATKIFSFVSTVVGAVAGFVGGVLSKIRNFFVIMFSPIVPVITKIFQIVFGLIRFLVQKIIQGFTFIAQKIIQGVTFLVSKIVQAVTFLAQKIWQVLTMIGQAVWQVVSTIASIVLTAFKILARAFVAVLTGIWNVLKMVLGLIYKAFVFLKEVLIQIFTKIFEVVKKVFIDIKDFVVGVINKIINVLKNLGKRFLQAGRNLMMMLLKGIKEGIKEVSNFLENKLDSLQDMLPFSPAKRGPLRERPPEKGGYSYMRNLSMGMQAGFPLVAQQMQGLMSGMTGPSIVQAVAATVNTPGPQGGAPSTPFALPSINVPPASPAVMGDSGAAEGNLSVSVSFGAGSIVIQPQSLRDGESEKFVNDVVRQVGEKLQQELRSRSLA